MVLNTASSPFTVFERLESNIRSYCRSFPASFAKAKGSTLTDTQGRDYLDFFAGAGALNLGHNPPALRDAIIQHLMNDGLSHALDMYTPAKEAFLKTLDEVILRPRGLNYRVQFTGPTGTNAVEAALKLARKITGRTNVVAFTGGYHGHSLGSLAATANREHRQAAHIPLSGATFVPFPNGAYSHIDGLAYLRSLLVDTHSGLDLPAAVILETVQGEGGIWVAPTQWLKDVRALCDEFGIVMIVDEIQTGCGRTGPFLSFERAGIVPDMVTISKSISGFGLPMSIVLIKPDLDIWQPAEHTGTFRGNQLAFVSAEIGLRQFEDLNLAAQTTQRGEQLVAQLSAQMAEIDPRIEVRGLGLMIGLDFHELDNTGQLAKQISRLCFDRQLIIERVGRMDTVVKLMPPLTITDAELREGVELIVQVVREVVADWAGKGH